MKDKTIYTLHSNICKALANPIRIEIIDILNDREMSFGEIQEITGVLKSNLSQRKEGLNMYFRLTTEKIAIACRMMREVLIENLKKHQELIKDL